MNYEKMTKVELISRIKSLESGIEISRCREAESTLRESEKKYQALIESTPHMFISVDAKTSLIATCNQPLVTELGYSREDIIGQHISFVYHPDCEEARQKVYYEAFVNTGKVHNAELQLKQKNGRKIDVILYLSFIRDDQDNAFDCMPGWLYITEQKKAEEKIKGLAKFPSENPNPVIRVFNDGRILYYNKASTFLLDFWNCQTTRILSYNYKKIVSDVLHTGVSSVVETECCRDRIISLTFAPVTEEGYVNIYGMDITERKKAEEKLNTTNESLEKLVFVRTAKLKEYNTKLLREITRHELTKERSETILRTALDCFWLVDIQGRLLEVNDAYCSLTGYSREELLKMCISDVEALEAPEETKKHIQQIIKTGSDRFESKHRCKDGRIICVEVSTNFLGMEGGRFFAFIRDITERKRSEEALAQSEQRFRRYFDLGLIGMAITSLEKGWVEFNDTLFKMFGYSRESFAKLTWTELTYPEDLESDLAQFSRVLAGKIDGYSMEKRFIHKDGNIFHAVISANAIRRDDGSVDYFVALVHDISESKSVELKLMEQKSALQQKNIALNEILGQIEIEKKQIKDNVIANAENLLLPVIQKLKLTVESRKYVRLLQLNLQELTSSFGVKLTGKEFKLTSREIEICNLIKNGLTSKEITTILNISHGTTERHRANIRRKLGIIKKDINLSSFLKTL